MNTIKWELEDLAFATLYPKRYDEIVRLVAERAPSRDTYLAEVTSAGHRPAEGGQDRGRRHRPAQALLLDLPEDDRARPRLHRHPGPGGHPDPGRLRARLLRGARHHARALAARAGPLQGLRGDAEVQHVPVAAHHGDRPAAASRSSCRSGRTTCTAPPTTGSPPTGSTRSAHAPAASPAPEFGPRRPGRPTTCCWLRQLLDWQREAQESGRVPGGPALRPRAAGGLRLHAQGRRDQLPGDSTPVDFAYAVHTQVGTASPAPG